MSLLESRDHYKPFLYPFAYQAYKTAQSMHWLPTEVPMAEDIKDWNQRLSTNEKSLLTQLFRFFTQADCFHPETEILTQRGWVFFYALTVEDRVAQVSDDMSVTFVAPTKYVEKEFEGELIRFKADRVAVDHLVTPGHNVVYQYKDEWKRETAEEVKLYQRKKLFVAGRGIGEKEHLTPLERILIAFQADGNVKKGLTGEKLGFFPHRYTFSKNRKITRMRELLAQSDLNFNETKKLTPAGEYTTFYVEHSEILTKGFEWVNLEQINETWAKEFIEELIHWDGTRDAWGNEFYANTNTDAVNVVQAVAALAGRGCYARLDVDDRSEKFSDIWTVGFGDFGGSVDCQHVNKTSEPYSGKVYCVAVPTGRVLVRANGKTLVSGNCDIAKGYRTKYMPRFEHPEIQMMFGAFVAAEANHIDAYSTLIDTLGIPESEYKAFHEYKAMRDKHAYMFEHESGKSISDLAVDIAVFSAFGEGMQLFSSFAILLSFQKRGLMKGMSQIVSWSLRDESHHVESMIRLFHELVKEHPRVWTDETKQRIYETCRQMVKLEDAFIDQAFNIGSVDGITPEETKRYIRYIADRRLLQLGLKPHFKVKENPFSWLDWLMNAPEHANFFETRATEYGKGEIAGWDHAFDFLNPPATPPILKVEGAQYYVFTMPNCPHCVRAKQMLEDAGIPFVADQINDAGTRSWLKEKVECKTFPMVYEFDPETGEKTRFIGGADALYAELHKDDAPDDVVESGCPEDVCQIA